MAGLEFLFSEKVTEKLLAKHKVTLKQVRQCFYNRTGGLVEDTREEHKTNPPTQWFIAETNSGRLLKVCFVLDDRKIFIKTAYEPNKDEIRIYNKIAK